MFSKHYSCLLLNNIIIVKYWLFAYGLEGWMKARTNASGALREEERMLWKLEEEEEEEGEEASMEVRREGEHIARACLLTTCK